MRRHHGLTVAADRDCVALVVVVVVTAVVSSEPRISVPRSPCSQHQVPRLCGTAVKDAVTNACQRIESWRRLRAAVNPLKAWRRCYATSALSWAVDARLASAI